IPRSEGEEFVKRYHERFPAVTAFREQVVEEATETGFVKTLLGRRRPLPELRSNQAQVRAQGVRLAMNTVVQGTAADIIKIAMIRSHQALLDEGLSSRLVLQIHDELLFEGPAEEAEAVTELARREMSARCWAHRVPTRRWRSTPAPARAGSRPSSGSPDSGMSDSLVVLLMVLVGVQFAAQAPVTGGLGRHTGGLVAALISFLVGNVVLLAIVAVAGQLGNFSSLGEVPLWQLAGGLIGATYVALAATTISRIGAGVIAAVTVTGQLACSVVVDHFGWFGIEVHDVTGPRILGLVLLLAGAMAMLYSREEAGGGGASRAGRQTGHGIGSMASGAENRERLVICAVIFLASLAVGIQHPLNSEL
ncbi:MAG TPA: DNA polymerase, partial [Solirubrobacterales bacterium]|nr:DNA polymerase [Solirubrobacterales bacterium]